MWILIFILLLAAFFIGKAVLNVSKDNDELREKPLHEKFNVIVNHINNAAFNGQGEIKYIEKNHFSLYPDVSNQIVYFYYSQGILTMTWKYKYFQKEMIFKKDLLNMRNLSLFEQNKIANALITEMERRIQKHKDGVWQN